MDLSKIYTVLVVHKSPERLEVLKEILQRAGYDVLKAANADAACKLAFTQSPHLILIEESYTKSDFTLLWRLREINKTANIPVLLTTSQNVLPLNCQSEASEPHPTDTLTTPYDEFQLVSSVTKTIIVTYAKRVINQSEQRYRDLFDNANDIIYTHDLEGHYTSLNRKGRELTGYSGEEAPGLDLSKIASPQDVALCEKMLQLKLLTQDREPTVYEMTIITQSGALLPVEISSQLIYQDGTPVGVQGIARDISKRKADERALREANEKLEQAKRRATIEYQTLLRRISSLAEMLGNARDIAAVFTGLVDFTQASLPCVTIVMALHDQEQNEAQPQFVWTSNLINDLRSSVPIPINGGPPGRAIASKEIVVSINTTSKTFETISPDRIDVPPPSSMVVPMIFNERVVALLEIHSVAPRAYTGEHKTAISMAANLVANSIENLRLLARDRERENQLKQSQKMEALGRLAGGVAHDFNNIMTAVYGYSDLAISELGNHHPKAAYFIQEAKKCGERAEPFIKQLLGFSRSQVLQPRSLNLNQAIEDFKSVINVQTGENITVHYLLDDRVPPVYLDPVQVQQILLNLAVNSRDAMPNGGEITIETRVARSARASQLPVILTFSDTGIGMDAETQRHIFEPFFTTKEDTGTGLGLSLVYGTVDQAGGAISVMSQPNKGTTFTIKFPAATSAEAASQVPNRSPKAVGARGHYKLLVAEDDLSVQTTTAYALRQAGYEVFVVDDGQQALDMIERDPDSINLVITDFLMPTMNGHQLATRIKEFKPDIKVICISGYAKDITSQQAELPQGTHFIQKPFSHAVLLHTVDRLLDDKTHLAAEL